MSTDTLPLTISWFETSAPKGELAYGDPERTTWGAFTSVFEWRREGEKDGPNFVPSRFKLESDGRHVHRLKVNVVARTAVALDIEASKKTGEVPPALGVAMDRAKARGLACLGYTSHSHTPASERYRLVFPLSMDIAAVVPIRRPGSAPDHRHPRRPYRCRMDGGPGWRPTGAAPGRS
jgi:hypothetical protein